MTGPPARARARRAVLATYGILAASVCAAAVASAAWPGTVLLAAGLLVPLLLPLPGLLRGERRAHAWATLCVAPCFIYGITEAVANPAVRTLAAAILFASLAHFAALVAWLRVTRAPPEAQDDPRS